MLVVVSYDVATSSAGGVKRLNLVSKQCVKYGQRVQNSVFECYIDYSQFVTLKNKLLNIMNPKEDNIRFYLMGNNYKSKIENYGKKEEYKVDDTIII